MIRHSLTAALTAAFLAAGVHVIHADVRAEQKTKVQLGGAIGKVVNIFGGKAARDGITSSVAVKGDRKATITDQSGQIIDLSEEKIYDLDLKKKTYTVVTFAELRKRMEDARKKAAEEAKKEQPRDEKPAAKDPNAKEYEVDFAVKNTGEQKAINGFNTHQSIVTITVREKGKTLEQSGGVTMTTDMWLAPKVAAMTELQQFDLRYAQKLYGPMVTGASPQDMATAMALYPQIKPALEKMRAEGGKIDGTPILTTTTMDAVKSADQVAQEQKSGGSGEAPKSIGGMLGGLGKKMAKKDEAPKSTATFLTSTLEMLKLTTDVPADAVAIPAGFREDK
ncbi:MAG: hypothetical protein ABI665_27260 [Vicinamibacterales bacterium]